MTAKLILKIFFYIIISIIFLLVCLFVFYKYYSQSPKRIADFIKENPERASILIVKNDSIVFERNIDAMKPLASTMKTIVLIEYAKQFSVDKFPDKALINLNDIGIYYVKDTDGGAHQRWIDDLNEQKRIFKNQVYLDDIVRGMMLFSSNACTEYLMDLLGIDNINANLAELNIKNHEKLFFVVSYLYLIQEVGYTKMAGMTNDELVTRTKEIHNRIKSKDIKYDYEKQLSEEEEELFSLKFTKSTASEYCSLLSKLYTDSLFSNRFKACIDSIYKPVLIKNSWAKHLLIKGGSTISVLTQAYYVETKKGEKYRVAYFLDKLEIFEYFILKNGINKFDLSILGRGTDFQKLMSK
jgi:D-alanyl-D-alanine carboxypeptidase